MFFVYGMHWQLNFTAGEKGEGQAVLIRALEPAGTQGRSLLSLRQGPALLIAASGPGRAAKFLNADGSFYGEDLTSSERIWVEDGGIKLEDKKIVSAKRVGIDYAQEWKNKKLRFYIKGNKSVSKMDR